MALKDAETDVDRALAGERRGLAYENAFGGVLSFMRRAYTKDLTGVDLAVTGVPFDQAVTNRPGARFGPRAIREASTLQPCDPPYGWDVDPLSDFDVVDYGDMAFDYARVADVPGRIEAHVAGILEAGAGALVLGGDHSVTLPVLRAHAARFGPVALLQFDAHSDLWPDPDPERIDHGTMFTKALAEGLIDRERSVQVGIRTVNRDGPQLTTIPAREVHERGAAAVARRVKEIVGIGPVYLSFDIDCLDPAFAPGTGTPVWGGLSSAQADILLKDIRGIDMVGGDVVEVAPAYDTTGATAIAGAHAAMELMCLYCHRLAVKRGSAEG
ncbi:agmatinase [Aestuariibius sp. 2305UL40-4]|uniref:agmatinase n=1 Tax=Aestuariibius violaceus TaxID=3234132 RepID=UPI00345EDAA3